MKKTLIFFALFCTCFMPVFSYGQVQVAPFLTSNPQFLDSSGAPCSGCLLYTYQAGTSTNQNTYSDSAGTVLNANPVVLDSTGHPQSGAIFLSSASYKFILKTSGGVTLWSADNVTWSNLAQTLTSLTVNGQTQIIPSTAATSGANQSGPNTQFCGNFWNGSASAADCWTLQDVLGTGTNPTTTLTASHSGSSGTTGITLNAPLSLGSNSLTAGAGTFTSVQGIQFINAAAVGTTTGGIQECINALPAGGGKCILPPNSTASVTATINVNKPSVEIVGSGLTSIISVNCNCDVLNVTQTGFILEDVEVNYAINTTRSGKTFILAGASVGLVRDVQINGSTTSPTNGTWFSQNGTFGAWSFFNLFLTEGGPPTWDSFISIVNGSAGTTSASYFIYNLIGGGKFLTAGILLDGALDTIQFTGGALDGLSGTSGPTIWVRNTVTGFIDPRWVHFNGFSCEAQGQTCVKVDNVRDFQYFGYVASSTTGIAVGASSVGANIHDNVFANIGQSAITLASGALYTNIHNNNFDDTANSANNTYDTISVAANTTTFTIIGNSWRNINGVSHPRYGINVIGGTSAAFQIIGNEATASNAFATSFLNDASATTNKAIYGNGAPFSTQITNGAPNSPFIAPAGAANNPGLLFSTDSSTGFFQLSAGNAVFTSANASQILWAAAIQRLKSSLTLCWAAGDPTGGVGDTCLSRSAAGVVQVGTSETANSNGTIKAAAILSGGSAAGLTGTGACATFSGQVGGAWSGKATCTGTTGASTITITPGTTAPNGWHCTANDWTTRANAIQETASTTTAATLTATSVTQNDVFSFSCNQF